MVDVFFVVVELSPIPKPRKSTTQEEIESHYNPPVARESKAKVREPEKSPEPIQQEEAKAIYEKDYAQKNLKKHDLPWVKK